MLGLLLLPARMGLRALDDLHQIALAGQGINGRLAGLEDRADRVLEGLEHAIGVAERIEALGEQVIGVAERIDDRAEAVLALGERFDEIAIQIVQEAQGIQAAATEVSARGTEVMAALPLLERVVELSLPLEGAVERLGRVVDRLPGGTHKSPPRVGRGTGRASRSATTATPAKDPKSS